MKNQKSLFQLIDKLKEIDVNEVIERSKNISIEDIKSIRLKDITSSRFFKPFSGIGLSIVFLFLFLIPTVNEYNDQKIISKSYTSKKKNLNALDTALDKSTLINSILNANLEEFSKLTSSKSKLLNITDLLADAAKRSLVDIKEFAPITKDEVQSCAASTEDDSDEFDLSSFDDPNQFNDSNDDFNMDESLNDFPDGTEENKIDIINSLNKQLAYIQNNSSFLYSLAPSTNTKEIPSSINDEFEENYFKVDIVADYINLLNFLRSLQEYKMIILPICFEPSLLSQSSNLSSGNNTYQPGFVKARIMFNVPTTK